MGNEKEEDDYDFYNYVSTMQIDDVEKSDSLLRETSTPWYFDNNSCGGDLLGKIDGLTFQGVEAEATGCGFYMEDRENIGWTNSESNGVTWELAIARQLLEFGLLQIRAGDTLQIHVGMNIFNSY